jgi:hypothetical protein
MTPGTTVPGISSWLIRALAKQWVSATCKKGLADDPFSLWWLPKTMTMSRHWATSFWRRLASRSEGIGARASGTIMGHLHQYGTECLIVDDAHDLSLEHLMLLKEVTDQGRLQYDHPLGLCLVAAGRGDTIPLKETFDLPDPRLSAISSPFRQIGPFLLVDINIPTLSSF